MKNSILITTLFSSLALFSFSTHANDKIEHLYNPQKYQQVCKGKKAGESVSFAHKGIIWNGTCQTQFLPSGKATSLKGTEKELSSICHNDPATKTINIEGKNHTGKCGLGFVPPSPHR